MKIADGALNEQNQQYERRPPAAAGAGLRLPSASRMRKTARNAVYSRNWHKYCRLHLRILPWWLLRD
jgi:hypothetical protein